MYGERRRLGLWHRIITTLGELGSGISDLHVYVLLVLRKRPSEHAREFAELALERVRVLPCQTRVEDLAGDALDRGGDTQVEDGEVLELGPGKRAIVHGVDDGTGVPERAALAHAVLAARPTGVDEPAVDIVRGHARGEHAGVASRVEHDERRAVARREGGDRLEHAVFRAGCLSVQNGEAGRRRTRIRRTKYNPRGSGSWPARGRAWTQAGGRRTHRT